MGPSARVLSVAALEAFHATLVRFGTKAEEALGSAGMVIRRALDDLQERHRYWLHELRDRTEELARIRSALSFARMRNDGKAVGCAELELELRKAVRRQREAEGKLEAVRRWQNALPEAVREYQGPARRLSGFLEADLRQAEAILREKIGALEAYLAMAAPASRESATMKDTGAHTPCAGQNIEESS